jgi:spermidine synthase
MKKYFLETIVFLGGAAVMVFELVGGRVLAPFVGTSIFVWSSLIGVILAALSAGYWWGGRQADKKPDYKDFSRVIFLAAVLIALAGIFKLPILNYLQKITKDIRLESVIATLILFAPASFFLAAISPYAARLRMDDIKQSGRTVGNLYAISTLGSILGTFLTGFVLFPYVGSTKIIFILAILMFLASLLAYFDNKNFKHFCWIIFLLVFIFYLTGWWEAIYRPAGQIYISTQYNDVMIIKGIDHLTLRPILALSTDPKSIQSAMYLDKDSGPVFRYLEFFRLVEYFKPDFKKTLMLGGAGYSFPKDYLKRYPGAAIDVVKIDPKMTEIASQYFKLEDNPRLKIIHEDGRTYLNRSQEKYDAIFVDVFKSYLIPFQMTTLEAAQKEYDLLAENGVVIINIISSIEGEKGKFLRAEYATYKQIFPQVYVFPNFLLSAGTMFQNLTFVALKNKEVPSFTSDNKELNGYLEYLWKEEIKMDMPVLTDDFAPVDKYLVKAFE